MREDPRSVVDGLRPELDFLATVCAGLGLADPVDTHLEPLLDGWSAMGRAVGEWSRAAAGVEALADDAERLRGDRVAVAVAGTQRTAADALRTAGAALERTVTDGAQLVVEAAELLADVGRTASLVLSLPTLGAEGARRMVEEADERVRVCAESVAELAAALGAQWDGLLDGVLPATAPEAPVTAPPTAVAPEPEVLHEGGVRVEVTTAPGSGASVEVTELPTEPGAAAAVAAASAVPPAAVTPAPAALGGGAAAGGVPSGSFGGGGTGGGGGGAAPVAAPALGEGSRTAAVDEPSGARPAAAAAAAPVAGGSESSGRGAGGTGGGMMPMGAGMGAGGGGQDQERKKASRYVADAEEVFGTPEKTSPPVIGERRG